ncbi:MAG: NAD(P)H-dependent oxidoreductase subunit E [Anaerolineae bacterium]|nr:NAD(P)H-dependent oxidoreductase subunit E [Anaerolineae bacterium]
MNRVELQELAEKVGARQQKLRCRLLCCGSTPCLSSGGGKVQEVLTETLLEKGLKAEVSVVNTGCMGPCSRGPLVTVQRLGAAEVTYQNVTPELAKEIVEKHVAAETPAVLPEHVLPGDHPFFAKQQKVVLSNSGQIDPELLEDYVVRGGYMALGNALRDMTPEEVCQEITRSGLRGRGGAGYPTGLKWDLVRKAHGDAKYVVANGDEGDPGAYMDRTLMESDPHRILEGMAIAGYAVGASQGYVYVRGEYPIAAQRLEKAIRTAERRGLLGSRVMDSNFSFRIDIRIGAGAFVCGEETALIASIMGKRGQPEPRPPYPSESGLWGKPTLLNNVETYGNIAPIIANGAEWYSGIGTEKSKGTKIFALAGALETTGLIEVPMGITLREIVYDIAGGIPDGRDFKAAQTGGPSGGCIPASHLDIPVDYESLKALGSMMGSGGLIVLDDTNCMPDVVKYFLEFCMDESCGKCIPCRVGTVEMHNILKRITNGSATEKDLATLEELCTMVRDTSLCGLGQGAPSPIVSTLRFFRDEYEAHIKEHRCPAGVCEMTEVPVLELTEELYRRAGEIETAQEVN